VTTAGLTIAFQNGNIDSGAMLICPHCNGKVAENPALAGTLVACPHCRKSFQQPAPSAILPAPVPLPSPAASGNEVFSLVDSQRPINVLVTSPRPQPRLHSGGWFSRAFSTTSGVLVAVLLFVAVLVGVPMMMFCGGCFLIAESANEASRQVLADNAKLTAKAKRIALGHLDKFDIVEIDSKAIAIRLGDDVVLSGAGRTSANRLRDFSLRWRVATFDGNEHWQLKEAEIDGKPVTTKD
jgi:hypothetical protein